jgi:hypothetical protein
MYGVYQIMNSTHKSRHMCLCAGLSVAGYAFVRACTFLWERIANNKSQLKMGQLGLLPAAASYCLFHQPLELLSVA